MFSLLFATCQNLLFLLGDQVPPLPWSPFYPDHCGYSLSKLLQQWPVERIIWFPPKGGEARVFIHQLPSITGWDLFPGISMHWHFDLPYAWAKRETLRQNAVGLAVESCRIVRECWVPRGHGREHPFMVLGVEKLPQWLSWISDTLLLAPVLQK